MRSQVGFLCRDLAIGSFDSQDERPNLSFFFFPEQVTPKAGHTSENKPEKEAGINSCKSLKDCCKTLVGSMSALTRFRDKDGHLER